MFCNCASLVLNMNPLGSFHKIIVMMQKLRLLSAFEYAKIVNALIFYTVNSIHQSINQCVRMHEITDLHNYQRNSMQGGDVCHDCMLII